MLQGDGHFVLSADDTNIFVAGKSEEKVHIKANLVLAAVHDYMIQNQLHINMTNSVYICIFDLAGILKLTGFLKFAEESDRP